ncbi:MAG TPA: hypothetical protein DHV36_16975 [Desulfobacteraceae bacterium]|nr:hypothetical protein [Desulfobacteraceae bacterium]
MAHTVRVLDIDAGRLMILENRVKTALRKARVKARISMVSDNLAITRQGLLDAVPVLEVNGVIVSRDTPLTLDGLVACFKALNPE